MQIELSPDDIETIIREADAAAQRLRRKLCLPVCEREDLGQDLLVDLLRRLPAYDPSRGSIGAFANIVLRNQSSRIAMVAARTSRSAFRLRASSATPSGRAEVAPRMLTRSRLRSLSSRNGGTFGCSPAATLAQYPRGGTGIRWRPQTFASPRSDIPNSCASAVIGLLQTRS